MTSCPAALTASKSRLRVKSWLQGEGLGLGLMVKGMYFVCEGPHNYTSIKTCFCVCVCGRMSECPFLLFCFEVFSKIIPLLCCTNTHRHTPTHTDTHKHTRTDVAIVLIHQADQKTRTCEPTHAQKHIHHAARKCTQRYTTESVCVCVCVCVCV